jgi:site-specific DNA-methyltransferase (adenine-specific)
MILNSIITGDSAEVLKMFDADCIDLTVTSPPYDNLRTYNGFVFDFETIARELYRVTKPGGVVVWVVGDATINGSETLTSFKQALFFRECGFNVETMIYQKDCPTWNETSKTYRQDFEYMFVLSKGVKKSFNALRDKEVKNKTPRMIKSNRNGKSSYDFYTPNDFTARSNIWYYHVGSIQSNHPAIFPEALARDHILSWSNPGDIVLDPFCGSGTTPKAAKQLKRDYIGIEISAEYVTIAEKRLLATTPALFA